MRLLHIGLSCITFVVVSNAPGSEYWPIWGSSKVSSMNNEVNYQSKSDVVREHRYTHKSVWTACGVIQYDGYDGWVSQAGQRIECDDKAVIHWVKDEYGSERAANKEMNNKGKSKTKESSRWEIAQEHAGDGFKVIELSEAVEVHGDRSSLHKWVLLKVNARSVITVYGPDKDHVMDYYYFSTKETRGTR